MTDFEGRTEIRKQEKIEEIEERDLRRGELPGKFMAKMLYGWDDGRFEEEYLRKLERNWQRWKAVSPEEKQGIAGKVSNYFFFGSRFNQFSCV